MNSPLALPQLTHPQYIIACYGITELRGVPAIEFRWGADAGENCLDKGILVMEILRTTPLIDTTIGRLVHA